MVHVDVAGDGQLHAKRSRCRRSAPPLWGRGREGGVHIASAVRPTHPNPLPAKGARQRVRARDRPHFSFSPTTRTSPSGICL